jgi:hypothetical protein
MRYRFGSNVAAQTILLPQLFEEEADDAPARGYNPRMASTQASK